MKYKMTCAFLGVIAVGIAFAKTGAQMSPPSFVTQEDAFEETCDGAFWHVQGIAISDDAVYCGLLKNIVKFDLATGKCLKGVPAPSHTGDVCWHNGRLYTSVLANFEAARKNQSDGRGVIQVYDADLNLIRAREFPMGFDGIAALDGILYLGRGVAGDGIRRTCRIVRVKEETLEFIDEVEIAPGFDFRSAVQDIATDGRHLFFSFYPVKGPVGVAVYTKDLRLVKTLPETFSNGFDRLPGRFQRPGAPTLFGVLRSFTRKDAQGLAVPGYSAYLQAFAWDGEALRDVTPPAALALRDRPSRWLNLFNGKDLSGWTPKIRGYKAGENPGNTFRVVDGCLCNRYDDPMYADGFKQRFGHLFYNRPFSNYVLRATYRMPLPQVKGGEGWAVYNNGIMLHGQTPESMDLDQSFPVSIEYQLLSRAKKGQARSTANLCTPGTNVEKDGKLYTPHVLNSTSRTCEPDAWTTVEAEVRGGERIIHRVDGRTVLEYEKPQYDPRDGSAKKLIQAAGGDLILRGGTISIQSESAPTDFKSILVRPLTQEMSLALPGWGGAPVEIEVQERYLAARGNRTALEFTIADDGTWAPSGAASNCMKRTDEAQPYVRFGGDDKRVGLSHGVKPAKPVPLEAGVSCTLEVSARVARGTDTIIVYMRAFDADGRDVTASAPAPSGWSYSIYSKCYVKYPLSLDVCGKWTTLKVPFRVPEGVAKMTPMVCPWRGGGADVRGMRIVQGAVVKANTVSFDARAESRAGVTRFTSSADALALEVTAKADGSGAVAFEAEVCDLSTPPKPRALDLLVKVPAKLEGWTWHRNWREDEKIAADSRFFDIEQVGGFPVTRYPFSAVSKDGAGFAFGTPLDVDAYENRIVTAKGIESRLPVGLLARGAGLGTRAKFRYLLFPFKGKWGFRSAAKAYYAREAHKMPPVHAGAKEGTWVWPIWPSKGPADPDDFGHTFWEAPSSIEKHSEAIRRAHELGIGVFPYTEVWGMRQHLPTAADGSHPPLTARLAELEGWAAQTNSGKVWFDAPREVSARACLNSMPLKPDGSHAYIEDHYSTWNTWWRTNPDPRLPKPNRSSICWDHTLATGLDGIDGVYLDSVSYGFAADYRNVRPEHLAVFDAPLIYDTDTLRPCTDGMQHMTTFIGWLAGKLHPKGKRLFGNTFGIAHRFTATTIDVFGHEVGSWGSRPCEKFLHSVITDATACEQRFFAYRRPVSNLLQEGHWERLCKEVTHRGMEMYIENQMFYAFYPAVSTIGGEEKIGYSGWRRYFDANKRYERDRELFKAAIPVIRRLNRAGWQPETLMRANVAHVWVERYGEPGAGECRFTVRNASAKEVDAILTPEFPVNSLSPIWHGTGIAQSEKNRFTVRLAPWQTAVFKAD